MSTISDILSQLEESKDHLDKLDIQIEKDLIPQIRSLSDFGSDLLGNVDKCQRDPGKPMPPKPQIDEMCYEIERHLKKTSKQIRRTEQQLSIVKGLLLKRDMPAPQFPPGILNDAAKAEADDRLDRGINRRATVLSAAAGVGAALLVGSLSAIAVPVSLGAAYAIGKAIKDVSKPAIKAHLRAKAGMEGGSFKKNLFKDTDSLIEGLGQGIVAPLAAVAIPIPRVDKFVDAGARSLIAARGVAAAFKVEKPDGNSDYDKARRRSRRAGIGIACALLGLEILRPIALFCDLPMLSPVQDLFNNQVEGAIKNVLNIAEANNSSGVFNSLLDAVGDSEDEIAKLAQNVSTEFLDTVSGIVLDRLHQFTQSKYQSFKMFMSALKRIRQSE